MFYCSVLFVDFNAGSESEPSPTDYDMHRSNTVLMPRAPSYSHGLRRGGSVMWNSAGNDCVVTVGSQKLLI